MVEGEARRARDPPVTNWSVLVNKSRSFGSAPYFPVEGPSAREIGESMANELRKPRTACPFGFGNAVRLAYSRPRDKIARSEMSFVMSEFIAPEIER